MLVLIDHYLADNQIRIENTVLESIAICLNQSTPMVCSWEDIVHGILYIVHCGCCFIRSVHVLLTSVCCFQQHSVLLGMQTAGSSWLSALVS